MVTIEQHVWGMTPEGEAIILYTMRNDKGAEVKISNFGAAIVSVTMPDREGRMADVVLGYKHPEGYFFDGAASGKSVGRCANRIASGRMTIEGKEYSLRSTTAPTTCTAARKISPTVFGKAVSRPTASSCRSCRRTATRITPAS